MKGKKSRIFKRLYIALGLLVLLGAAAYSLPLLLALAVKSQQQQMPGAVSEQFPVTVDPQTKTIVENTQVDMLLDSPSSPLEAAVENAGSTFWDIFEQAAAAIAAAPWYQSIAATDGRFVTITAGMRKEQVASVFAVALGWNAKQQQEFLTPAEGAALPLAEGSFEPGTYFVPVGTTPKAAQAMVNESFSSDVLSHYGTTTAQIIPLDETLTIASLIQRETEGTADMRVISGIIWNRLFANMNLQIDSTLQYAKANAEVSGSWWPVVLPSYESIKSPYNTYLHSGLPPTPIANPSVAAILAALNPVNTPCYFYFNDKAGGFHCSATYAGQVALLKEYYGQGK